jgi:peptidoglycan hydrolase-like protein with peptidoglycan-binding domain
MEETDIRRGSRGLQVRLVQEWLCLHGIAVDIDGAFGPATEAAVRRFQEDKRSGSVTGIVDNVTMDLLTRPLDCAQMAVVPMANVGLTVVKTAKQHLREHPREVGGKNRGPWVRAYCGGNDGKKWLWCAGFVCTILEQAFGAHGKELLFPRTYSCDTIAKINAGRLIRPVDGSEAQRFGLRPGAIFLIRKTETDWTHTGICTAFHTETFETIEGNSDDEGSREGTEVCARIRGYRKKDFIPV